MSENGLKWSKVQVFMTWKAKLSFYDSNNALKIETNIKKIYISFKLEVIDILIWVNMDHMCTKLICMLYINKPLFQWKRGGILLFIWTENR